MNNDGYLMAERMIPHRRKMMLLERVKKPDGKGLRAETRVKEDWPMVEQGAVSTIIGIELLAQSVSAFSTWRRGPGSEPRIGLIVGIKSAEFSNATMPVGIRLTIRVDEVSNIGNYGVFRGEVSSDSARYCKAVLQVLDPDKDILKELKTSYGQQGLKGD